MRADARRAGVGLLLLSRLCRDQRRRHGCQAPAAVLAADLGVKPLRVLKLLDDFEHAGIIERHRQHPLDSDELPLYSVPLADPLYPIDLGRLDPDQTRLLEHLQAGEHDLTVLGPRGDLTRLAVRLAELRAAGLGDVADTALGDLAATNLTGAVVLAADALAALDGTLGVASRDTYPTVHGTPGGASRDTSKTKTQTQKKRYADDDEQDGQLAHAGAAAPARAEELSGEEERVHRAPSDTARAAAQRFEAPHCPIVGYTATAATHERIVAVLDAVAAALGDGEAREAAYQAVFVATAEWSGGAKGSDVLSYLKRRFARYDPEQQEPDVGLDFGAIGETGA